MEIKKVKDLDLANKDLFFKEGSCIRFGTVSETLSLELDFEGELVYFNLSESINKKSSVLATPNGYTFEAFDENGVNYDLYTNIIDCLNEEYRLFKE